VSRVAIITGVSKGIGQYLRDHYLEQGFQVAGCSRSEVSCDAPGYRHYCLDVADEKAVQQMVKDVRNRFGGVDVLLNNAGIASMNHILLTPLSTVQSIFATNVFGTFLFCREAAKVMALKKSGRIVNFATVATPLRLEGEAVYAASKAAIESFTRIMAREVAPYNITVNAVGPTPVQTDLIAGVPAGKMDALLRRQAIQRFGTFQDISNVTDFFIDERSDFVTGQVVFLGGVS
jgi:3-oxoacyl-[acyl-carrier protein] reductase